MRKVFFILFVLFTRAHAQVNIIQNGGFTTPNHAWAATGEFRYSGCLTLSCSANNPYAFTSGLCANVDNASGTLSQATQTIPLNASGGNLKLKHRIGTSTNNQSTVTDYLRIYIEYNNNSYLVKQLTNLDFVPGNSCVTLPAIDISTHILARKGLGFVLKFQSVQKSDGKTTVFRLDDVSIDVTTVTCSPPPVPVGLKQSGSSTSSVTLSWKESTNANSYIIKNCSTGTTYTTSSTSYTISGLNPGSNYSYQVSAVGSSCNSNYSGCISVTTDAVSCSSPFTPSGLVATPVSSSQINLKWNAVSGASSYDVFLCGGTLIQNVTTNNFSHTGLLPNTAYYYQVRAKKSSDCTSPMTSCVNTTTQQATCNTPGVTASSNSPLNINETLQLMASPSQAGTYTYSWTGPAGFTSSLQNPHVNDFNHSKAGNYCVIITKNGCTPSPQTCTNVVINNPDCIPPITPTGLKQTSSTSSSITLSWNHSADAKSYVIKNCTSGQLYNASSSPFTINGLNANTSYSWQIIAAGMNCHSEYSNCINTSTTNPNTATYVISGKVNFNNTGLAGVTIATNPSVATGTTNAQGNFTMTVPSTYSGTITPSLNSYSFSPSTINVNYTNSTGLNFVAEQDPTISISSYVIPPWQRENDDYEGSISISSSNSTAVPWFIRAKVYSSTNQPIKTIDFPASTSNTQTFNTAIIPSIFNIQLKEASVNGCSIKFYATLKSNNKEIYASDIKIIEKKWTKKNIVYWRDLDTKDIIKIPIKWSSKAEEKGSYVKIKRVNSTSIIFPLGSLGENYSSENYENYPVKLTVGKYPSTLKYSNDRNEFPVFDFKEGFCEISVANSNIFSLGLLPGDFKFEIYNKSRTLIEAGYFDLTKIGRINGPAKTNKILVIIGGILNESEISAWELKNDVNSSDKESKLSYSVLENIRAGLSGYSSWYIAQGNSNTVRRNGYDIGIALERIRVLNNIQTNDPEAEIVIICHSKGGLDTRALLSISNSDHYLNESFNGESFHFKDSAISSVVKKVVFLGTPHLGSPLENLLKKFFEAANSPGGLDLKTNSEIIQKLGKTDTRLPANIKYCNVTGYTLFPNHGSGDLIVPESSSLGLVTPPNTKVQLHQLGSIPSVEHLNIHQSNILNYKPIPIIQAPFMCFDGRTNLEKIKEFIRSGDISLSCNNNSFVIKNLGVDVYKSKVSNAAVYYKKGQDSYLINRTDKDGKYYSETFLPLEIGDSIYVEAAGIEPLTIPINKPNIENKYLFKAATFKLSALQNKIVYPSFELLGFPITKEKNVKLLISGLNIKNYFINKAHNDSVFLPIYLDNGITAVDLDTGYNKIVIRLIGLADTLTLEKDIFYLPEYLASALTRNLEINSDNKYLGTKIYINGNFFGELKEGDLNIMVFKDYNKVRFSRFGYYDTTYIIDSIDNIQLEMQPRNYSSVSDSNSYNFFNNSITQYWKNITLKNISPSSDSQISIKQFNDLFSGKSLKPQTRKFVFRNLGNNEAQLKTSIALDQIETPDPDSVYLLAIKNGQFKKYESNQPGVTEYDPHVQKLAFDSIQLKANEVEELVLMKKQRAKLIPRNLEIYSGDSLILPLNHFITDPDSIKGDIKATVSLLNAMSSELSINIKGNSFIIKSRRGFTGTVKFSLNAEHDFLQTKATYEVKILAPQIAKNKFLVHPNPVRNILHVEYILTNSYWVNLKLYDTKGTLIKTYLSKKQNPGYYYYTYDISGLPAGTYIIGTDRMLYSKFIKH